jgi:hypothetical protein
MDEHEAAQHEAEHKAAALHHVGWETGSGATIWAQAVRDVLALHESARKRFAANDADREAWERLHGCALMVGVAVDQVLAFAERVRLLSGGDAELAQARGRFDAAVPDAKMLGDIAAHLDEYAAGEGWRQTGKRKPPLSDKYVDTFLYWSDGGSTMLHLGDQFLNLRGAAEAASELATVVERVRARHLARVEREANDAMRRRFRLPPEEH